ncbi:hypothetical protein ACM39_17300 [Chryseobacterium sp. FH2]|uniref:hypothetical protein n=1 Tax=Chryseobacterium sp. FH2 TaxID=1674291 RepID=UPI00065AD427|nr:hypothetical protein [Chryseobacterium sp. FH2]KMQ62876.1 hypothetical protein ACM39_17300 [Chryseobacterium sp. FH2]
MKILLEEKILGTRSKKNSKYYWVLETITGKNDVPESSLDYFPSSSEGGYIQDIKDEILEKINSGNIFSFPYTPKEGDYLSIKNNLRKQEYLNIIFINNNWMEEVFVCSYRDCDTDIYKTIKTGVAILSQDI